MASLRVGDEVEGESPFDAKGFARTRGADATFVAGARRLRPGVGHDGLGSLLRG